MRPDPLPFRHCYWVVPGKLLAGRYPGSKNPEEARQSLTGLVEVSIRRIINLEVADERDYAGDLFVPYEPELPGISEKCNVQIAMIRLPIRDMEVPSQEQMVSIPDEIDRSLAEGLPVYVHCCSGKRRTGTVVGCYLARHGLANGWDALRKIKSLRRGVPGWRANSPQSLKQYEMVPTWPVGR